MVGTFGLIRFTLASAVVLFHSNLLSSLAGRTSVLFFYFLSGIVMQLAIQSYTGNNWYPKFIFNRFLRLFPSFITICILTLFCFYIFTNNLKEAYLFSDLKSLSEFASTNEGWNQILHIVRINTSFELGILTGSTPIIPQGWSLVIEFLFYLTLVNRRKAFYFFAAPVFALISVHLFFRAWQENNILIWYENYWATAIFFILGSLLAISKQSLKLKFSSTKANLLLLLFFILFFAGPIGYVSNEKAIFIEMIVFSIVGLVLFSLSYLTTVETKESDFSRFLGKLSYPMYVSHIFCIGFLNALGVKILVFYKLVGINEVDSRRLIVGNFALLTLFLTSLISILLTFFIENPVEKMRKLIKSR